MPGGDRAVVSIVLGPCWAGRGRFSRPARPPRAPRGSLRGRSRRGRSARGSARRPSAGELAADGQTEAEAAPVLGCRAAPEALEDPLALLGRDAGPVVGDRRARQPPCRRVTTIRPPAAAVVEARCRRGCAAIRATRRGRRVAHVGLAPRRAPRRGASGRSNSATTARASSSSSTGSAAQLDPGVEPAEVEQRRRRACRAAPSAQRPRDLRARLAQVGSRGLELARSAPRSMSRSEASGVRSSCDAVLTNVRRAPPASRSRRCMVANARVRSPTSSRCRRSRADRPSGPSSATPQRGAPQRRERAARAASRARRPRRARPRGATKPAVRSERADDVPDAAELLDATRRTRHASGAPPAVNGRRPAPAPRPVAAAERRDDPVRGERRARPREAARRRRRRSPGQRCAAPVDDRDACAPSGQRARGAVEPRRARA